MPGTHEQTPSRWRLRRRSAQPCATSGGLFLQSLGRTIDPSDAVNRPLVGVLMTEDFCWRSAVEAWRARKPRRWHRAKWSAWRAEQAVLEGKRSRIRELASELGFHEPA
ncbi:MAG TPA: hypothetical protein VH373_24775 [Jatrophihabitantaceae bacterium]